MPNDNGVRRTPVTILVAGAFLVAGAAVLVIFAILMRGQTQSFADRAAAVDPTGPENPALRGEASDATWGLAIFAGVAAVLLLASAFVAIRKRNRYRALWRWIGPVVVSVLVLIYPIRVVAHGGVGVHIIAIPHTYTGDNAVRVVMTHAFQHRAVTLAEIVIVTLVGAIVFLLLPMSRRYYESTVAAQDHYDLSELGRRRLEQK